MCLMSYLQINTIKHKPKILFLYALCIKKEDLKFSKGKCVLTSCYESSVITRICWQ